MYVFAFCSTAGWLLEVVYRSIRLKKFINPGFLAGCCLPIYGVGGVIMYFLCSVDTAFISNPVLRVVVLTVCAMVIMTAIEFLAGFAAIKFYHNRLWDYSGRWLNYKGIICPLFTCIWGVICVGYYFILYSFLKSTAYFLYTSPYATLALGVYFGVFLVDLITSLDFLSKIKKYAISIRQIVNLEKIKMRIREIAKRRGKSSLFGLKIHSEINNYIDEEENSKE